MTNSKTTLITGATGLVGGALAHALLDDEESVTLLVRSAGGARELAARGARIVVGDLSAGPHLDAAVQGAQRVVHCAARAGDTGDIQPFLEDNVEGARRLAQRAAGAGIERFVHVSSISVHGNASLGSIDETRPTTPIAGYPYAESKRLSEAAVAEAESEGMQVFVCRLGSVYGPASHHWTVRPVTLMTRSPIGMLLVEGGEGLQNPIFLDDAVTGLRALAAHEGAAPGAYFLTDDAVTYETFFRGYAAALSRPFRARPVSRSVARTLARGMEAVARLRGKPPLLTRIAVDILCRQTSFSSAKLRRETGWAPVTSLPDGQAACVRWLKEQGMV